MIKKTVVENGEESTAMLAGGVKLFQRGEDDQTSLEHTIARVLDRSFRVSLVHTRYFKDVFDGLRRRMFQYESL